MNGHVRLLPILSPALAFKGIIIGGGYATGRELVEFFFGGSLIDGYAGMIWAGVIWSIVCVMAFLVAFHARTFQYSEFMKGLTGPLWPIFDLVYIGLLVLIISVFCSASGEILATVLGIPATIGVALLAAAIIVSMVLRQTALARLFAGSSVLIYVVYGLVVSVGIFLWSDDIGTKLKASTFGYSWLADGALYSGFNLLAVIAVLPFVRSLETRKEAVWAGALCGPLAIIPGLLFLYVLSAFYPEIRIATLPSDRVLREIGSPVFLLAFQAMVLIALFEGGVGLLFGLRERLRSIPALGKRSLNGFSIALVIFAAFIADRIGLVALIASGYRIAAIILIVSIIVPLLYRFLVSRNTVPKHQERPQE